jgi:hypothetical protein
MHRQPAKDDHILPSPKSLDWGYVAAMGFVVVYVSAMGYAIWHDPWKMLFVFSCVAVFCVAGTIISRRRERRVAASRPGESICTFARSFDCRATDTWIIRAVYEKLQPYVAFPLRADDHLHDDLRVDPEDLQDTVEEIAVLVSRPLQNYEKNPLYGKVETLTDLVSFFSHQEKAVA